MDHHYWFSGNVIKIKVNFKSWKINVPLIGFNTPKRTRGESKWESFTHLFALNILNIFTRKYVQIESEGKGSLFKLTYLKVKVIFFVLKLTDFCLILKQVVCHCTSNVLYVCLNVGQIVTNKQLCFKSCLWFFTEWMWKPQFSGL